VVTLWYNHTRFGGFGFGYEHLTVGWQARILKWGLVSYHYLARNLAIVTSSLPWWNHTAPRIQINTHGLALWVTTPIYLWLFWPKNRTYRFNALLAAVVPVFLFDLLYPNSGWLQFGYRFSNDFAVFLFAMLVTGGYHFGRLFYALATVGIVVNGFGALTFQRRGYEAYYYSDGSQTVIFQPD